MRDNKEQFLSYKASEEVDKQLTQLENDVDQFIKDTEEMLASAGVSEKEMRHALWKIPENLPEEQKEALLRAKKIREEIQDTQLEFQAELTKRSGEKIVEERPEGDDEKSEEKPKKKKDKSHKSKFKRLGGDHWKPL